MSDAHTMEMPAAPLSRGAAALTTLSPNAVENEERRLLLVRATKIRQQIAGLASEVHRQHEATIMGYIKALRAWEAGLALYPLPPDFLHEAMSMRQRRTAAKRAPKPPLAGSRMPTANGDTARRVSDDLAPLVGVATRSGFAKLAALLMAARQEASDLASRSPGVRTSTEPDARS